MAEERLIDDDKDRKYKIRINEDGEEELVIDDSDVDEEDEVPVFEFPEYDTDDEDAAILTPEQLAERERLKAEEERIRSEKLAALFAEAREKLGSGDFEGALYSLGRAEDIGCTDGEFYALKLRTLSRDFTDYTAVEDCVEVADGVREHADEEQKLALKALASGLKSRKETLEKQAEELREENEKAKNERRGVFAERKKSAFKAFIFSVVPFAVLLVMAIGFSTVMFAEENGVYLILTAVFAALAVVAFIVAVATAKRYWAAQRKVVLNERDTSTELGRNYLEKKNGAEQLSKIYSSFDVQE